MWAIEASPSPKAAYRWGWYHFEPGDTTYASGGKWCQRFLWHQLVL